MPLCACLPYALRSLKYPCDCLSFQLNEIIVSFGGNIIPFGTKTLNFQGPVLLGWTIVVAIRFSLSFFLFFFFWFNVYHSLPLLLFDLEEWRDYVILCEGKPVL